MSGEITEISTPEILLKTIEENESVIIIYTAKWCVPCKKIYPYLKTLAIENEGIFFYKIDVDNEEFEDVLKILSISSIPTLHFFHKKEVLHLITGADIKKISGKLEEYKNDILKLKKSHTEVEHKLHDENKLIEEL